MESLLRSDAPLFGRMTGKLYVPPFQFTEIESFIKRYSLEKQLAVYAIIGIRIFAVGTITLIRGERPQFLSTCRPSQRDRGVDLRCCGAIARLPGRAVISLGKRGVGRISATTLLDKGAPPVVSTVDLRLIEKRIRASVPSSSDKALMRVISWPSVPRFYTHGGDPIDVRRPMIYEPILATSPNSDPSATFEELCRTWTLHMGRAGRLPFIPEYVGSDWRGSEVQLDVMAVNWREGQVFVGEAKWGEGKVDHSVYTSLAERVQRALAYMPSEKPWTVHLALFARKGYTPAVVQAARTDGVQLLTFEQIVSDLRRVPGRIIR
jgi:hypothetical protein